MSSSLPAAISGTEEWHASLALQERSRGFIEALLNGQDDIGREGLADTPRRFARAMSELTEGYKVNPADLLVTFESEGDAMVAVKDIPFASLCIPSKQLVNVVGGAKPARLVRVGDKLWTLDRGRAVETTVVEVASRQVPAVSVVEVETDEGVFRCTEDHPFATFSGWVEAQDLEGQFVEWTRPRSLCRTRFVPLVGYSLGYAIGVVASDGSVAKRHVTVQVTDRSFAERYCEHLNAAFDGMEARVEYDLPWPSGFRGEMITGHRVRVTSSYLADLFRMWLGGDAHHMRQMFPHVVKSSLEMAHGFVDGYADGDGHRSGSGRIITCGNVEFLREFARLVSSRSEHGHPSGPSTWNLYVSNVWDTRGGGRQGWYAKHGFEREDHRTDLVESQFVRVQSVVRMPAAKKPYTVYSFRCDPHPTFLVSGHLSHNCEHHMLPFTGTVSVAYVPTTRIVGLSKIPRVVRAITRRLQVQERIATQVAKVLQDGLQPLGLAVMVRATHSCMVIRGVESAGEMVTTVFLGTLRESPQARAEALEVLR